MLAYLAIGLAVVVGGVPASFAQDSRVVDHCKSAGTGIEAEEGRTPQRSGSKTSVDVAVPIGKVCVGPDALDGEPTYVRRTTAKEGMAIVEVSTTPFMPVLPPGVGESIIRTDQPAGW